MIPRSRAPSRALLVVLLAATLPSLGCDLLSSAKATIVVAGLVVASPEVKLTGYFNVPSQTSASVFLGDRNSATSTEEPDPITGAAVQLEFAGNRVALTEQKDARGVYVADSAHEIRLMYQSGLLYAFSATPPASTSGPFGGTVTAPTQLSAASLTLTPTLTPEPMLTGVYRHPKDTALTVAWSEQNGRYAYVTVLRANAMHPDQPEVVFDNRPTTAGDMLKFVLGTPPTSVTIPKASFARDGAYAVLVVIVNKGAPLPNTSLASPLLAGSGEKILLAVGNFNL